MSEAEQKGEADAETYSALRDPWFWVLNSVWLIYGAALFLS